MRGQVDVGHFGVRRRIDQCRSATAVSDNGQAGAWINANIVRVVTKRNAADWQEVPGAEQTDRSITCIGDQYDIGLFGIADTLRFAQSGYTVHRRARCEIDDVDRIVAQFRHDQPLARQIDRHVVNSPGDIVQRYSGLQDQRWLSGERR